MQSTSLNFKKAMDVNNDLVKLYAVLSETELETDRVNLMKEGFVTVIEEELRKLQESRIVI